MLLLSYMMNIRCDLLHAHLNEHKCNMALFEKFGDVVHVDATSYA